MRISAQGDWGCRNTMDVLTRAVRQRNGWMWGVLLSLALCGETAALAGDATLPGHHPLDQTEAGEVLLSDLRCAACHRDLPRSSVPEKTAPDLRDVGARVSPEYLRAFLANPESVHLGATMPDLLADRTEPERARIADALTHFLVARSSTAFSSERNPRADRQLGKQLYHSVGCVACHGAKKTPPELVKRNDVEEEEEDEAAAARRRVKPIHISLTHVASKYSEGALGDFLFQPLRVRGSGRMPDMKLTPDESLAIASYLLGETPRPAQRLASDESLAAQGRKHFQELNCAACHELPDLVAAPKLGPLDPQKLDRGCLASNRDRAPRERSPRFQLTDAQVQAIQAALRRGASPEPADRQATGRRAVAKTLTAFRCVACHVRDDYGGVHAEHDPFFVGSELKLGDDGRIPPPLTLVGAKLRPAWLKRVLFDGDSVRQHYMATRMPQFGAKNLPELPALFGRLDSLDGVAMTIPSPESRTESEREREKTLRAAGRELLGDKGLNCIACHTFNGKAAQLNQGIDLLTSFERLQPVWFNRYLRNPGAFRPRTVMPTAWPNGQATFKNFLDGDTDRQIEAIWYYLSLGTSAADPPGVRGVNTKLTVDDLALIHRGRSRVAGFRGIAVGLPEKLNYAFNAETGTLSAVWRGDFVHVNWSGQGAGDFHPASEPAQLAQDVSFARLADENDPWPLLPVLSKEARTNPNPLYPKNVGYQFRGYYFDSRAIPTFQYRSGEVEIDDKIDAQAPSESSRLRRVLTFESPAPRTLWFRALTGEIQTESERSYRSGRLSVSLPSTATKLRPLAADPKQAELLIRIELPAGKTSLELVYELLQK